MSLQDAELAFETGQAGLVSPCASTSSIDPPAHVYQATSVVVDPAAIGTTLPVGTSTTGNVTTFSFQAPSGAKGNKGDQGAPAPAPLTVQLPSATLIFPQSGRTYLVTVNWNPTEGEFLPLGPTSQQVQRNKVSVWNKDDSETYFFQITWAVYVVTDSSYGPVAMNVSAQASGQWNRADNLSPVAQWMTPVLIG